VVPKWKELLVGEATKEIAKLQQDLGTEADVIIESGHLHTSLNAAAAQAKADLMVIGHLPTGGHLGENGSGHSIIRASHVPVLSL
jgi:nucleotide-binding universal stress UspA family protein